MNIVGNIEFSVYICTRNNSKEALNLPQTEYCKHLTLCQLALLYML